MTAKNGKPTAVEQRVADMLVEMVTRLRNAPNDHARLTMFDEITENADKFAHFVVKGE